MKKVLVAVAHPDDETLWCGGTLLMNRDWDATIFALTRKSDPDRAPKFFKACGEYKAKGLMADLDDGPGQKPLLFDDYRKAFTENLSGRSFDIIVTHSPFGEYTRHQRHEELSGAVSLLLFEGVIQATEIHYFWYSDEGGKGLPSAGDSCDFEIQLTPDIFEKKSSIVFDIYGFSRESWEGRAIPRVEGFKIRKEFFIRKEK